MKNENNTQHTPGPWKVGHPLNYITDSMGVNIAKALHAEGYAKPSRKDVKPTIKSFDGEIYKGSEIAIANAKLIASAPDLLNDLRGICNYASQKEFNGTVLIELISGAMQTVLKAEGKNLNV